MRHRPSIARVLVLSLALGTVLPFLPLAWGMWVSYQADLERIEQTIQAGNRQIAHLAGTHLEALLRDAGNVARVFVLDGASPAALPVRPLAMRWELVGPDGRVVASQLSPDRVAAPAGFGAVLDERAPLLEPRVTEVGRFVSEGPPTFLLVIRIDARPAFLVGVADPTALHAELTAESSAVLDRHVYAVDRTGQLIFYSSLEVSRSGRDLRSNPPVRLHIEGRQGPVRFQSLVSGKERLGFVRRLEPHGIGVIVSADIGARVVDVQERYELLLVVFGFALLSAGIARNPSGVRLGPALSSLCGGASSPASATTHGLPLTGA